MPRNTECRIRSHFVISKLLYAVKRKDVIVYHFSDVRGPAEIPDDLQTQLRVEPLARGICP
jgi:hypothetical protein